MRINTSVSATIIDLTNETPLVQSVWLAKIPLLGRLAKPSAKPVNKTITVSESSRLVIKANANQSIVVRDSKGTVLQRKLGVTDPVLASGFSMHIPVPAGSYRLEVSV